MSQVVVYGTGGHAKVVVDILTQQGVSIKGMLDDREALWGKPFRNTAVLGGLDQLTPVKDCKLIVAVGDNRTRRTLALKIASLSKQFELVVHNSAQIAQSATLGTGSVVMAHVAVNADTVVGQHVILNTGCTVDHDCVVGDFAHISPGAHLAGGVRVGAGAHVGVGVSVIPKITIGEGAIIGAGAAVVNDIPPQCTAVGVPAKIIKQRNGSSS